MNGNELGEYEQIIHELSERIVLAQKSIRILDSLKWNDEVEAYFFNNKCKKMPPVN